MSLTSSPIGYQVAELLEIVKLIELAESGEIDPWDVQVIEIIDRLLCELPQKTDLAQSGQTFLWASMLVLLKANTLASLTQTEEGETIEEIAETELTIRNHHLPLSLEKHLHRRSSAPPLRQRRVTLEELIKQIREIEKQFQEKPKVKRPRLSRYKKAELITELAHQENLTETANSVAEFLEQHRMELEASNFNLQQLLELLNSQQSTVSYDPVGVFWALLLLSAESKVELTQEEFYQDLIIKPLYLEEHCEEKTKILERT